VAALVAAGIAVGTAWWLLAPDVTAISTGAELVPVGPGPETAVSVDVLFVALTVPVMLVATWLVRRRWQSRPALGAVLVAVGGLAFTVSAAARATWQRA
jgi:hypothetical protein